MIVVKYFWDGKENERDTARSRYMEVCRRRGWVDLEEAAELFTVAEACPENEAERDTLFDWSDYHLEMIVDRVIEED